ncbi:monovalent cation:proton antiporter-2 (CPA2) family protein [Shimia sp. FJ5]|uniref:monovalent cation:proton antiporter-2 (CPA2) family protein n=1 Tax=Shimia sp. FJ5 TaxID=3079054 RepID=UPI002616A1A5|nr:monovalent cation:proton antiporter-2 (CPA2) family protein [Shimia sp. FJ5]MDV4145341.1 monovalent cation:proton antiporter-2 (CPA2) family protein [Shimia sp. FJ5]
MDGFLLQTTIFLGTAVIAVPISARLGMGSVLGYLLAGVLIGPILGLVEHSEDLLHFAEFGVVMMLFLIGLELDPRALWAMRHKLIGLGGLQVLLTGTAITAGAIWMDQPVKTSIALGMIFALSSTAIVIQTLSEKNLMKTGGGRSAFAVLLTQDIAVIPMLAILPLLAAGPILQIATDGSIHSVGDDEAHAAEISLVEGLPGWGVTLVTVGAVVAVILAGRYLVRPIFRFIHSANLREMYTAFALLIVIGIALLMTMVGLSPALGTFLAGVILATSEFRHELESDIQPFKGLLLGLFFITVGSQIDFAGFFADPAPILSLTLALIFAKAVILFGLGRVFGLRGRDQVLFTLSLAQAGEFGFVLISFALQQHVLEPALAEELMLVVALSMLITPLLFIAYDLLTRRMSDSAEIHPDDEVDEQGPVIIAGIGRFGQIVNRLVRSAGFRTVVLDHDMRTIELMRRFGVKGFFGDPTRPELLHAAGLAEARVLVVALDDPKAATKLVAFARRDRPDLHIVARAHDRHHTFELFNAGANDIVREMFDSSLRAGRYVLENVGLSEYEAAQAEQAFYKHDRYTIRELAQHWDPKIPTVENRAYIARAKELEKELEMSLLALLETERKEQD